MKRIAAFLLLAVLSVAGSLTTLKPSVPKKCAAVAESGEEAAKDVEEGIQKQRKAMKKYAKRNARRRIRRTAAYRK